MDRDEEAFEALIALAMLHGLESPITEEDLDEDNLPELSPELKRLSRENPDIIKLLNKRIEERKGVL